MATLINHKDMVFSNYNFFKSAQRYFGVNKAIFLDLNIYIQNGNSIKPTKYQHEKYVKFEYIYI